CKNHGSPLIGMNTACDQVDFRRISLIGFRSYASRSQTGASQSRQSTDCQKFDSWKNLTSPPTKSLFDVGSCRISIFTCMKKQAKWNSILVRLFWMISWLETQ
nr:hypothetical protein [Tanacetum cinerariifolium]